MLIVYFGNTKITKRAQEEPKQLTLPGFPESKMEKSRVLSYRGLAEFLDILGEKIGSEERKNMESALNELTDDELSTLDASYQSLSEGEIEKTIEILRYFYSPDGLAAIAAFKGDVNVPSEREIDEAFYDLVQRERHSLFPNLSPEMEEEFRRRVREKKKEKGETEITDDEREIASASDFIHWESKGRVLYLDRGAWYDSRSKVMYEGEGGFLILGIPLKNAIELAHRYRQYSIFYAKNGKWWEVRIEKALEKLAEGATEDEILASGDEEEKEKEEKKEGPIGANGDLLIPIFKTGLSDVVPEATGMTKVPDLEGVGIKGISKKLLEERKRKKEEEGEKEEDKKEEGEDDEYAKLSNYKFAKIKKVKYMNKEQIRNIVVTAIYNVLNWSLIDNYINSIEDLPDADARFERFLKNLLSKKKDEIIETIYDWFAGAAEKIVCTEADSGEAELISSYKGVVDTEEDFERYLSKTESFLLDVFGKTSQDVVDILYKLLVEYLETIEKGVESPESLLTEEELEEWERSSKKKRWEEAMEEKEERERERLFGSVEGKLSSPELEEGFVEPLSEEELKIASYSDIVVISRKGSPEEEIEPENVLLEVKQEQNLWGITDEEETEEDYPEKEIEV